MRTIVTAVLILVGVLILPVWNRGASAEEGGMGGPGMKGPQMTPEIMMGLEEMMRGIGMMRPGSHGRRDHERPLISLMLMRKEQLGLSADQERALKDLRTNFEKESIKRTAEIDVAELEMNSLLEQEKVDIVKVEVAAKKIAMLQAELRVGRIKTIEAGKAILTPEQATKFERLGHESLMGGTGGLGMTGPSVPPRHPGVRRPANRHDP